MAIRWLFFDLGSTLVDESLAYENRVKTLLAGSELDYQETWERLIEDYKKGATRRYRIGRTAKQTSA